MGGVYKLNIWFVKFLLLEKAKKLKLQFLMKLYVKIVYNLKFKYNYIDDLQRSFESLFILLEYNNYNIKLSEKGITIRSSLQLKNILYIETNDYTIKIDIDKISWIIGIEIKDLHNFNRYYSDGHISKSLKDILPYKINKQDIIDILNYSFKTIFNNFKNE